MKKKMKLKPFVLPMLYLIIVVGLMWVTTLSYNGATTNDEDLTYVSGAIFDFTIPVLSTNSEVIIVKPFTNPNVKVERGYYDYKAENSVQENSIIYYEDTYMQNSGISYTCDNEFEVISILEGTVIKITDNEILGKTVEIRHDSNLISIYHSITDIKVSQGDAITQNQIIGKSGTAKIFADKPNKLHFEVIHNGKYVNPEKLYDKKIKEL
jgi:Membrane proteins related to metalloendopeptidases